MTSGERVAARFSKRPHEKLMQVVVLGLLAVGAAWQGAESVIFIMLWAALQIAENGALCVDEDGIRVVPVLLPRSWGQRFAWADIRRLTLEVDVPTDAREPGDAEFTWLAVTLHDHVTHRFKLAEFGETAEIVAALRRYRPLESAPWRAEPLAGEVAHLSGVRRAIWALGWSGPALLLIFACLRANWTAATLAVLCLLMLGWLAKRAWQVQRARIDVEGLHVWQRGARGQPDTGARCVGRKSTTASWNTSATRTSRASGCSG